MTTIEPTFALDQLVWWFDGSLEPREGVISHITTYEGFPFSLYKVTIDMAGKPWETPSSVYYLYARPADRERLNDDVENRIDGLQSWLKKSENTAYYEREEALALLDNTST